MGSWRHWWWTGVLVVGTGVNCSEGSDPSDLEGDAGASSAGVPNATPSGGSSGHDDDNGGAAGADHDVGGGAGNAGELLGGAAGWSNAPGEGGRESQANHAIADDVIADDAEVVTKTCDGEVGQASIELTRYCLLDANCNNARDRLGNCVWLGVIDPCLEQATTCAEVEACKSDTEVDPLPAMATRECVGDVLHITDVEGDTREDDCAARGLRCLDVEDPAHPSSKPQCVPSGCVIDHAEAWGNVCDGDDLIGKTDATTGGEDVPATVTVRCPDFGYTTCRDNRCVY